MLINMESSVCLPDWSTLLIMEGKKVWHIWWEVAQFCCCLNPKFPMLLLLLLLLSWRFVLARVLHSLLLEWNSSYCCCCHGDLHKQPIVFPSKNHWLQCCFSSNKSKPFIVIIITFEGIFLTSSTKNQQPLLIIMISFTGIFSTSWVQSFQLQLCWLTLNCFVCRL